jgi:hypothetical protein
MRVSLSAGRLGQSLSVYRPALQKKPKPATADEPEQYQLFDTPEYTYRVFVTNMKRAIDLRVVLRSAGRGGEPDQGSQQRCGSEGVSLGAVDDELQSLPVDDVGLQPELLANAVQPRGGAKVETLQHTTLATAVCGSCFSPRRSGVTRAESVSATAIIMPSKESFSD